MAFSQTRSYVLARIRIELSDPARPGARCVPAVLGFDLPCDHDSTSLERRPVGEQDVARVEPPHVGQPECDPFLQILEEGATLAEGDRADHDPQLVEDARGREAGSEVGATHHEQLAAGSCLDLFYPLNGIATDDGSVGPAGVFERGREDQLGFGIHPGSDGGVVGLGLLGRPVGGHVFVGRPTEAKGVRFVELANGEVVELLVHDWPVELTVRAFIGMSGFADRARSELLATGERARKRTVATQLDLTPQEMRISELASQGATNQDIAGQLFISINTVEYHLSKVYRKLGIRSRTQLASAYLHAGRGKGSVDESEP